jgi:hypothetical protein
VKSQYCLIRGKEERLHGKVARDLTRASIP